MFTEHSPCILGVILSVTHIIILNPYNSAVSWVLLLRTFQRGGSLGTEKVSSDAAGFETG